MAEFRYTTGGTVQAQEGGLYLQRPADQQLLELCRESRFAYVLTPRQLGKSSLMIRTAEQLLDQGFRAALVDLTQIGTYADADTWYGDVLEVVADQLELATNARAWWRQQADTGLTLRLTRFFEEVVLAEVSEPIVIFVDEIDTTLSLAFTDDFFAAIRYFYVARAQNPELRRLSFVLIGVATPADLIRDPKRTPFNIGERVDLRDFTPAEAAPLAEGLPLPPLEAEQALGWILGWTGGHPYLSQRLCSVLAEDPPAVWSEAAVDQAVGRSFFGERSEQDNNLQFVRDMLTKRAPEGYGAELLRTYRSIWQGKQPVADEEQNLVHAHLKLAGVVRRDGRELVVRNRLYQAVFNAAWIEEHNPEDFWKRYGPVLKWAVPVSVSAVLVAGVMTALALEARRQADIAMLREQVARVKSLLPSPEAAPALVLAMDGWSRGQEIPDVWAASASALLEALQSSQETNLLLGHDGEMVVSVAFSPDGRLIASASANGTVQLWDSMRGVAIDSPMSRYLGSAISVAFSPDGRWIAAGTSDGLVRLWDVKSSAAASFSFKGHQSSVYSVAFSPNGRQLVSGSRDGTVRLWDAKSGAAIGAPLKGHEGAVMSVAFSPDGRQLASGSFDRTVRLWDAKSGTALGAPLKGDDDVLSVVYSPDGQRIASAGGGGAVQLWDAKRGEAIGPPLAKASIGRIYVLAFSPDGRLIACGINSMIFLLDAMTGAQIGPPLRGHSFPVRSVAFSPDGRRVVSSSEDGSLRLWDVKNGVAIGSPLKGHHGPVKSVAVSTDGRQVASIFDDQSLWLWDSGNGGAAGQDFKWHKRKVNSIAFSPDGRVIASGGEDHTVRLWDTKSGTAIGSPLEGHVSSVDSIVFSPDGRLIASKDYGDVIHLWDAKSGAAIGSPLAPAHGNLANRRYGLNILAEEEDSAQALWNQSVHDIFKLDSVKLDSVELDSTIQAGKVISMSFGSDGRLVAAIMIRDQYDADSIRLVDVKNDSPIGRPIRLPRYVVFQRELAFNPDARIVATGGTPAAVRLWDANSGEEIGLPLRGHEGWVTSVAFSPDGRMIASGSLDGVRLWDAKSGTSFGPLPWVQVAPHMRYGGMISSLAFSNNGRIIASGSLDGTVRRWIASPQEWFRLACARKEYHPLLRNPASVSTNQEVIAAGKRVARACQATSRSAEQAQSQGPGQAFAGLLAWAKGLLGG
jgi:WD40 repeat protein